MSDLAQPVLITGANGFLGSWIIARLIEAGRQVVACDLTSDNGRLDQLVPREKQSLVQWCPCDVTDSDGVCAVVEQVRPAAIVHLAALQIPACRANPVAGAQVNVVGHVNVFDAARRNGVSNLIYTSSIAAKPRGPANAPGNLYGVFKKADEEIARIYWEEYGVSSLGLRPYVVYGVGRDDGETSAITKAIRAAALGEAYAMPFATTSCFQYAGEAAEVIYRCASAKWDGAMLSDLTTKTNSTDELIETIRTEVPDAQITRSDTIRVSPTEGFDNTALKSIIGDWPRTSLADGVRKTMLQFQALAARNRRTA